MKLNGISAEIFEVCQSLSSCTFIVNKYFAADSKLSIFEMLSFASC